MCSALRFTAAINSWCQLSSHSHLGCHPSSSTLFGHNTTDNISGKHKHCPAEYLRPNSCPIQLFWSSWRWWHFGHYWRLSTSPDMCQSCEIVWQISSQPFDQFPETRSGQSGHRQNMRRIKAIISQIATMSRPVLGRAATLSKVTPRWWTGVDAGGHGWRARRGSGPCPSTPDHRPGSRPLPHCCCICLSSNALLKIREKVAGISSGCWGRNQSLACCHLEVLSSVPRYSSCRVYWYAAPCQWIAFQPPYKPFLPPGHKPQTIRSVCHKWHTAYFTYYTHLVCQDSRKIFKSNPLLTKTMRAKFWCCKRLLQPIILASVADS